MAPHTFNSTRRRRCQRSSFLLVLLIIGNIISRIDSFVPTTTVPLSLSRSSLSTSTRTTIPITTTSLAGTLSFSGDSSATLEFLAEPSSVQEWLQSPASDFYLLGTTDATQQQQRTTAADDPNHDDDEKVVVLWNCRQPRINFLGLDVVPVFVCQLERSSSTTTVSIVQARTEIFNGDDTVDDNSSTSSTSTSNRANHLVASVMERSTFVGNSVIRASSSATNTNGASCQLSVDLSLTLQVPLPPYVLLPPGFNSLGSVIVRRTGRSRTKQLLQTLKQAYQEWVHTKNQQQQEQVGRP
jgi:hypothetical protein